MKTYFTHALGTALFASMLNASAAEDENLYPGTLCRADTNTPSIQYDSIGRMLNVGAASIIVNCPVVRDTGGDEIEFAAIDVIDNNNSAGDPNVTCTLYSRSRTGGIVASELRTSALAPGSATLQYAVGTPNLAAVSNGYYYFRCSVPGVNLGLRSGVVSYRVVENVGED